jgi:uncharacterized protein YggE
MSQSASSREIESVIVTGTGSVQAAPDVLTVDLAVEVHAAGVDAALASANEAMSAIQRAVLSAGVRHDDLQTADLAIRTDYDHEHRRTSGFVVTQALRVLVRDVSTAGAIISAAAAAGGDATRVHGVTFAVEDDGDLLDQARQRALADARHRADLLATAAGRRLGRALRIVEQDGRGEPRPMAARAMAAEAANVPLQPGSARLVAGVTVEWALE